MSYRLVLFSALLFCGINLMPDAAHAQGLFGQSPAKATLLAEHTAIQPGTTFTLGVLLTPDDGWHTYWINPGESGLPTKIFWVLPDGFKAGDIQWPTPHAFETGGIIGLGYPGPVLLSVPITAPQNITTDTVTIKAKVAWLVCKEACVPGRATLSIVLPIKDSTPAPDPQHSKLFEAIRDQLPKPLSLKADAITIREGKLSITLPGLQLPHAVFYACDETLIDTSSKQNITTTQQPQTTTITVPLSMYAPKTITRVQGVIVVDPHAKQPQAYAVDVQLQP
jgi:thiol:disulfide interchange protein DsbD